MMNDTANLVVLLSVAIYVGAGLALLIRRQPVRAGLAMALASLIPLTWQVIFTDSEAPGFAFLLVLMLPTAVGVAVLGFVWWLYHRLARQPDNGSQA